ncbi:MAG: protein kinase [Pyrinomonadaceae bacterium]
MKPETFTEAETIEKDEPLLGMNTFVEQDPLVDSILDNRYLLKRKIGHGGFGAVYLASDEKMMSRSVVVKILIGEKVSHEWSVKKFKQEMEAMARIDHPSIVGVFDSGQMADGKPYIVMQYVDGVSLRSLINAEGMDFTRAANVFRQIGKALTAAHDRGILHRDLKPENIMLQKLDDGDEQVKIIDFGIAKVKDSVVSMSSATDGTVGTAAYMSPEQLSAGAITPASDVYSFAIIAYELLTGRRPMNPDSAYQLLEMQRGGVRIKPTDLRPNLSGSAEAIILKALSFEARDRYMRARDFGDLLSAALASDDEETELQTKAATDKDMDEAVALETAHVLFMDIVGYSRLLIDEQKESLHKLQKIVLATRECSRWQKEKDLIRLPTGDGMALVFFRDPEAPVRGAVEISRALREQSEIELRMGIHSGLVYHIDDINANMNVAGGGINIAQRVMDCGDSGHILLSKRVADDLGQLARWSNYLRDLGYAEVKHGVKLHLFNLSSNDFGNPEVPAKFAGTAVVPVYKRTPVLAAGALILVVFLIAAAWYALRPKPTTLTNPSVNPATLLPAGPEQSLTYWLTVQKMLNSKPLGAPIESEGNLIFGNGWKFRLNLRPTQSGALYLINVGPGKNGGDEYNVLFPLPASKSSASTAEKLDARLAANQTVQLPATSWLQFVDRTGLERVWLVWSAEPLTDLDTIIAEAVRDKDHPGVIANPDQIKQVQAYFQKYEDAPPKVLNDKGTKRTSVKGIGKVVVNLIELSHDAI